MGHDLKSSSWFGRFASTALTFFAVVVAWVFFRAENLDAAMRVLHGMAGVNGLTLPAKLMQGGMGDLLSQWGATSGELVALKNAPGGLRPLMSWLVLLSAIVWLTPNTQQIMANFKPVIEQVAAAGRLLWKPSRSWMVITAIVLLYAFTEIGKVSEFLYFQF